MAQLEDEIFARLSASAGVTGLLGTNPCRAYPVQAPQNAGLPYVVFTPLSTSDQSAMGEDAGLYRSRVQFDVYAAAYNKAGSGALQVRDALRAALKRYSGGSIDDIFLDNEFKSFTTDPDLYRITLDFIVWHREAA